MLLTSYLKIFKIVYQKNFLTFYIMLEFLKLKEGSFFVLIRKKRGKIFGSRRDQMFRSVQNVAKSVYQNYSKNYPEITYN